MGVYPRPMKQGRFWALVADSGGDAGRLKHLLLHLSREDILAFDLRLYEALQALNRRDIHDVTDGSDDGFLYVRLRIVSRAGRISTLCCAILKDAPHFTHREENEEFMYAAPEAYQEEVGEPWPEHPHHAGVADGASWL